MPDRPNAQELIEAVADFIKRELTPTITDQRLRFRSLIAANVLTIVARELAAGETPLLAEWGRLTALLGTPAGEVPHGAALVAETERLARELCAQIRAGAADDPARYQAIYAHAEASVIEKLQIANPKFLERIAG